MDASIYFSSTSVSSKISDHQPGMTELKELTTSVHGARNKSYDLSSFRTGKYTSSTPPTHAKFERTETLDARDGKGLTFHGIILRSQLAEMFKNKIFFNESDGVSCIILWSFYLATITKFSSDLCSLSHREPCHTLH